MRVYLQGDEAAGDFAVQLLAIGDGKYPTDTGSNIIQLVENIGTLVCSVDKLVSNVRISIFAFKFQEYGLAFIAVHLRST